MSILWFFIRVQPTCHQINLITIPSYRIFDKWETFTPETSSFDVFFRILIDSKTYGWNLIWVRSNPSLRHLAHSSWSRRMLPWKHGSNWEKWRTEMKSQRHQVFEIIYCKCAWDREILPQNNMQWNISVFFGSCFSFLDITNQNITWATKKPWLFRV